MTITERLKKHAILLTSLIALSTPTLCSSFENIEVERSGQRLSFEYDTDKFEVTQKKNSSFTLKSRETSDTIFVNLIDSEVEKELGFEVKAKDYLHFHPSKTDLGFLHLSAIKDQLFESQFTKECEKPWWEDHEAQVKKKRLKRAIYRRFSRVLTDPERNLNFMTYVGRYEPYGSEGYICFFYVEPCIASICLPDNTAEYQAFIKSMKQVKENTDSEKAESEAAIDTHLKEEER